MLTTSFGSGAGLLLIAELVCVCVCFSCKLLLLTGVIFPSWF